MVSPLLGTMGLAIPINKNLGLKSIKDIYSNLYNNHGSNLWNLRLQGIVDVLLCFWYVYKHFKWEHAQFWSKYVESLANWLDLGKGFF